jgi:hypothetical protein
MSKYLISRAEAVRRLRHRWAEQIALDPELLSIVLNKKNVTAVRKHDLYVRFARPQRDHRSARLGTRQ